MKNIKLEWNYYSDAQELNKLPRDKNGIYLWIMKHDSTPHIFYVGEGILWKRTISHFLESIIGRWMMFCWGIGNDDYMTFLKNNVSGKSLKEISDNKTILELGKAENDLNIMEDILKENNENMLRRIEYINKRFCYAAAWSDDLDDKQVRLAVETLIIKKLKEFYIRKYKLEGLKHHTRPLDYFIAGIKKEKSIMNILVDIQLNHSGDYAKLPKEVTGISTYDINIDC